jgi:hypothetical protein
MGAFESCPKTTPQQRPDQDKLISNTQIPQQFTAGLDNRSDCPEKRLS